ncbi:hypothetical protein GCM10017788_13570 [Amycolatopsis acidiphila]|nr:hypothetical protein GCM10017788_13570 [Amycolatopsis acidiphila]
MGGGLLIVGAAGYGFLALSGHTLSTADAAAVASLYLLINMIGPGVFSALEQETSRTISARLAAAADIRQVRRRAALVGAGLLVVVVLVLLAASPVLVGKAFGGRWILLVALIFGSATSAAVYLVRGLLGGSRRFGGYATTLAAEGLARLVPCIAVAVAGSPNAATYALLFAAGSAVAALAGLPALRGGSREPSADSAVSVTTMARASAVLVGSTLLAQLVANLAPVVVSGRLTTDTATAAAFASAFVLVRIPLFVFAPVQAMLLPTLTAAATRGDLADVRRKLRLILAAVTVVGVLGALVSFALGPWAVRVLFGAQVTLPAVALGVLGLGTFALLIAQVLQPALVALGMHRAATLSWLVGSAVLTGLLFLPGDPLRAAVLGQIVGSVLVVAGMGAALSAALREKPVT